MGVWQRIPLVDDSVGEKVASHICVGMFRDYIKAVTCCSCHSGVCSIGGEPVLAVNVAKTSEDLKSRYHVSSPAPGL